MAALGSYLDARHVGGRWLVRIEDLDAARSRDGWADHQVRTLAAFALQWDGRIEFQSRRSAHYRQALEQLRARQLTFECSCSRRALEGESGYPGTCRNGPQRSGTTATRFRVPASAIEFADRLQGPCRFSLSERGDVIVRRRDGLYAYQLAVVVDDALQGVTDVVRGADLLDSTPWQIALQQALGLSTPRYAHLPLVVERGGGKLAKSRHAVALEPHNAGRQLFQALELLRQAPLLELAAAPPAVVLEWAVQHWRPQQCAGVRAVEAP